MCTTFEDPRQAAKAAGATNSGLYALQELQIQLAQDEFPLYLAAEWGQTDRLIHLFHGATDQLERRRRILHLLGPMASPTVLSTIAIQRPPHANHRSPRVGEIRGSPCDYADRKPQPSSLVQPLH